MTRRLLGGLVLALVAHGIPAPAHAQTPAERIERARLCYVALDFACAEAELAAARPDAARLDGPARAALWRLSAEVALADERPADAHDHLVELVTLEPTFAPPASAWPPAWLAALDAARRDAPDRLPPSLEVNAPAAVDVGADVVVTAIASDPSGVGGVRVFVDGAPVLEIPMTTADGRSWRAVIPGRRVIGRALGIWVEAVDRLGNGPARWASASAPHRVTVVTPTPPSAVPDAPAKAGKPLRKKWWFWTALGAGLATTGALVYVLSRPGEGGASTGGSGVEVRLTWPER